MLAAVRGLINSLTKTPQPEPEKPVKQPTAGRNMFATGTFEDVTLFDLIVTLNQSQKTAKVLLRINDVKALIVLAQGEIVTALYQDYKGEEAIMKIFSEARAESTKYLVVPLGENDRLPTKSRISASTEALMLRVATMLDEKRKAEMIA